IDLPGQSRHSPCRQRPSGVPRLYLASPVRLWPPPHCFGRPFGQLSDGSRNRPPVATRPLANRIFLNSKLFRRIPERRGCDTGAGARIERLWDEKEPVDPKEESFAAATFDRHDGIVRRNLGMNDKVGGGSPSLNVAVLVGGRAVVQVTEAQPEQLTRGASPLD